tara:strand:- start:19 stop:186 length:168 start_codon:yes stop_codon:yes gene_type:complete
MLCNFPIYVREEIPINRKTKKNKDLPRLIFKDKVLIKSVKDFDKNINKVAGIYTQ